jgi:hypothetical protein
LRVPSWLVPDSNRKNLKNDDSITIFQGIYLDDILEAQDQDKSFWWRWHERFSKFFDKKFGPKWEEQYQEYKEFWEEYFRNKE